MSSYASEVELFCEAFDRKLSNDVRPQTSASAESVHRVIPSYQLLIPPEILSKIFLDTLDGPIPTIRSCRDVCPWNLTQVCSLWRAVALTEPQLWERMTFITSSNETFPTSSEEARVPSFRHHHITRFLKHLQIKLSGNKVDLDFVLSSFSQCGRLSELEFLPHLPVAFVNSITSPTDRFPWAQLTTISFIAYEGIDPQSFLEILRQSPNLITAKAVLDFVFTERVLETVTMPHLVSLQLDSLFPQLIQQFLNFLILPRLEELSLGTTYEPFKRPWTSAELIRLVERSQCSLKVFETRNLVLPTDGVLSLLPLFPDLKSLTIQDARPVDDELLETMEERNLVPDLETLILRVESLEACQKLLQTRYQGIPSGMSRRMMKVNITAMLEACRGEWDSFMAFIKKNAEEGRTISVEWYSWDGSETSLS